MDSQSITHTRWIALTILFLYQNIEEESCMEKVKKDLVEIIKKLCEMKQVNLIYGRVCLDHVHMYVAILSKMSVSDFMSYLKGKSALMLSDRHNEIK